MKLPDIGAEDALSKNPFSLNKEKVTAQKGIADFIVKALGIGPNDVIKDTQEPKPDENKKDKEKLNKTLDSILKSSKASEKYLKLIAALMAKESVIKSRTAKVSMPEKTVSSKGTVPKQGVNDLVKMASISGALQRIGGPKKQAQKANWEVLDREGKPITPMGKPQALPASTTGNIVASKPTTAEVSPVTPEAPSIPGIDKLGAAFTSRAPILLGAAAADTALGAMGVGGKEVNDEQDAANWERMSLLQKVQSGFGRGVEKVGTVLGMGNMANEARYQRISNETAYFRNKDMPKVEPAPKPVVAPITNRAPEMGPPRELFQAELNQKADALNAAATVDAAGYTTVTGRSAFNPKSKEMQPADYEEAVQAQAAREAAARGLRQRKGGEGVINTPEVQPIAVSAVQPVTPVENRPLNSKGGVINTPEQTVINNRSIRKDIETGRRDRQGEALRSSSMENRNLDREFQYTQVQPIIVQNTNNMESQNFMPVPAQPRSQSSFGRYQEKVVSY